MPELPEVETVRATLALQLIGETIIDVDVYYERIIQESTKESFVSSLINQTFTRIERYGKYLFFILTDKTIISHLRMEGKYFIKDIFSKVAPHEHIIFKFKSGKTLRYHDTRKFGTMKVIDTTNLDEIMKVKEISRLAKEATDESFMPLELYNKIKTKKEPIKTALLDQSIICGMGNIYVDEVCFLSNLHPLIPCYYLTLNDCEKILKNARIVLAKAILAGGTTIRSYTSSLGVTGRFQLSLYVHMQAGKQCQMCSTTIEKIQVGGRGTYFCSKCQKNKPKLIVGITGTIASGKSKVSEYLIKKGYQVIDTDYISRSLTAHQGIALPRIKEVFGCEYFNGEELNRQKLGEKVFTDPNYNKKLTDILHPMIKEEVLRQINESSNNLIFVDVPLLFESNFDQICNYAVCVFAMETVIIDRLIQRDGISYDYAVKKINSQMDLQLKMQKSHFIIDNSYDLCYTYSQVDDLLLKLLKKLR